MDRLVQDVRTALRSLRRSPTFVIATVLILGLGIGMAVAMWTTVNGVLLRRLPVTDQNRLAVFWTYQVPAVEYSVPAVDLPDIQRSASRAIRSLAGLVHWGNDAEPLVDGDRTIVFRFLGVTANYFDVLGVRPALGRLLRPEDATTVRPQIAVISYDTWQSQFGGSPSVVGRRLMDPDWHQPVTIIGVAPAGLDHPAGVEAWYAIGRDARSQVFAVARLADGATIEAARQEFFAAARHLEPVFKLTGAKAETFTTTVVGNARPILLVLSAAVALLLAMACINVGALLLTRATSRSGEMAVRRALGATRADIIGHLLGECVVVAAAGGVAGLVCVKALLSAIVALAPADLPRISEVDLHANLLTATVGVTMLVILVVGLLPATAGVFLGIPGSLQLGSRSSTQTRRQPGARQWLVASQVGLALMMLVGASLLGRSLLDLEYLSLGYRSDHLAMGSVNFNVTAYDSLDKVTMLEEQVMQHVRAITGVTAVTPTLVPALSGPSIWRVSFEAEGQLAPDSGTAPSWPVEISGPEYFRTLGIPIIRGRPFLADDRKDAPPVVIVSNSVARRFWPGTNPIGKRLRVAPVGCGRDCTGPVFAWRAVVGLVPETRLRSLRETWPMVYLPLRQFWSRWQGRFAVRSSSDVGALAPEVRQAIRAIDPTLAVYGVRSMDAILGGPLAEPRLTALLVAVFGIVALILAAVGLYGVIASGVRERTHEIGVRLALGASPGRIREAVLRQTLMIAGAGACVGLAAALATTRLLRALLFGVQPTDPLSLAAACAVLVVVAVVAAYVPARRATQVDPVRALRAE